MTMPPAQPLWQQGELERGTGGSMDKNELQAAAEVLLSRLAQVKPGEVVVITADMLVDPALVEAISAAATKYEARRLTVWMDTPAGVGESADADLPAEALKALLRTADVWIELNNHWLLYSGIYYDALKNNKKLRHIELTGSDCRTLVECVGKVDYEAMTAFTLLLRDKIRAAHEMRMTSLLGEDIRFCNQTEQPVSAKLGIADKPGTHLFVGQIGWLPEPESINGKIVFDGAIAPDIGILNTPIEVMIEKGRITSICGGSEAAAFEAWLKGFDHPQMLGVAHTGIGFNPGAAVVGSILEDQRVWGSTTWGFGSIGAGLLPPAGVKAPAHSDAVCLNTTLEVDGVLWMKDGQFVEPELAPLAAKLLASR